MYEVRSYEGRVVHGNSLHVGSVRSRETYVRTLIWMENLYTKGTFEEFDVLNSCTFSGMH